jgi:hypothetical protein
MLMQRYESGRTCNLTSLNFQKKKRKIVSIVSIVYIVHHVLNVLCENEDVCNGSRSKGTEE